MQWDWWQPAVLEKDRTDVCLVCHWKCNGLSLSFRKEITIITNSIVSSIAQALHYFNVQASQKFGSPKALSARENIHAPAVALRTRFWKTTEHYSKTMVCTCLHFIYTYLLSLKARKQMAFCIYKLRLNIALSFSYLEVGAGALDGTMKLLATSIENTIMPTNWVEDTLVNSWFPKHQT